MTRYTFLGRIITLKRQLSPCQDWLPTEAKQDWTWSVPGWETSW